MDMMLPNRPDCGNVALPPKPFITTGAVLFALASVALGLLGLRLLSYQTQNHPLVVQKGREVFAEFNRFSALPEEARGMKRRDVEILNHAFAKGVPLRHWTLGETSTFFINQFSHTPFKAELEDGRRVTGSLTFWGKTLGGVSADGDREPSPWLAHDLRRQGVPMVAKELKSKKADNPSVKRVLIMSREPEAWQDSFKASLRQEAEKLGLELSGNETLSGPAFIVKVHNIWYDGKEFHLDFGIAVPERESLPSRQ